jgi:hypothetical protein
LLNLKKKIFAFLNATKTGAPNVTHCVTRLCENGGSIEILRVFSYISAGFFSIDNSYFPVKIGEAMAI